MRRFTATAAVAALLSVGVAAPAFAAVPDAPTNVAISWADANNIKLSWVDADLANTVYWQLPGGNELKFADVVSTAANEILVPKSILAKGKDKVKLIVKASNAEGESAAAPSPEFDTFLPGVPVVQDANLAANAAINLKWALTAVADSGTPNDPLDVPGNGSAAAVVDLPGSTPNKTYDFAVGATTGVVPAQARPSSIRVVGVNEWGSSAASAKIVKLGVMGSGITVPASALYSNRLAIKSSLSLVFTEGHKEKASGIKVELQARGKTTEAFKTYGRYTGATTAAFDTGIAALGNRQYRLYVPARKVAAGNIIALTPATSTSVKSSKTYVKFVSGGFSPSVVKVGGRSTLSVKISPAVSVRAKVQGWDGKRWIDIPDFTVPLTKGSYVERGDIETERYTLRLRFIVPNIVVNGLTVQANTSPAYNLTVK
ncbi:hypothetical protein HPO96_22120 [Kribbella sandramycini]|uniref:Fibronectin type-III domain-containing protein n=1 Tax=Kribbella sandramycini TaxID=60450 RepID=A0A7Y4P0A5_9ACTN|nr:hypothetical protein [Kribbella sandramycini]MBB6566393.1 hypothetical protein [Kribbella sandramycini]NOL42947.1 hypothetical protein [Kribbella sandramycini]